MKKTYCDCCKREVLNTKQLFSVEIKRGQDKDISLEDVCIDCYETIKNVIEKLEYWRKEN